MRQRESKQAAGSSDPLLRGYPPEVLTALAYAERRRRRGSRIRAILLLVVLLEAVGWFWAMLNGICPWPRLRDAQYVGVMLIALGCLMLAGMAYLLRTGWIMITVGRSEEEGEAMILSRGEHGGLYRGLLVLLGLGAVASLVLGILLLTGHLAGEHAPTSNLHPVESVQ